MIGDELGVEQGKTAGAQPGDEVDQRDLRGVARAVEHALAEEDAGEADPVKTADQRLAIIDLDGMAMPALEQGTIELADAGIDPGPGAAGLGLGAAIDHRGEVAVAYDTKAVGAHRADEPRRHVEALDRQGGPGPRA